jgi:hemoglobin
MKDITTVDDIKILVDTFYTEVQKNELLASVFAKRITDDLWPVHLEKMYRFWSSILLYTHNYNGSPFDKHMGLGIKPEHFETWLALFEKTIDSLYKGENANIAKERAQNIARIFEFKLSTLE